MVARNVEQGSPTQSRRHTRRSARLHRSERQSMLAARASLPVCLRTAADPVSSVACQVAKKERQQQHGLLQPARGALRLGHEGNRHNAAYGERHGSGKA